MSKFQERENKRSSVVEDIVKVEIQTRQEKEKKDAIPRTFYIYPQHIKALAFEKAETNKSLSEIVRESLDDYFSDKLEKYK